MSDGKWVGIAEGSRLLKVSQQALRGRVKRKTIENRLDNHGRIQVYIREIDIAENGNIALSKIEQDNNNVDGTLEQHKNEEVERFYTIIQGQQRTIDNLTNQLDKGQAERREVLKLLSRAQDVILELKDQKKIADDRSRKAIKIIKEDAAKA